MRMPLSIGSSLLLMAVMSPPVALAQSAGGFGGLLGGGVPSLGGVGAGNATGLLSYCVKNQLLGSGAGAGGSAGLLGRLTGAAAPTPTAVPTPAATSGTAQSVLGLLLARKNVTSSPGFAAGQAGQLQLGGSRTLPVAGLQDQLKSRLCSAVLGRARSFL